MPEAERTRNRARSGIADGVLRVTASNIANAAAIGVATPVITHVLGVRGQGVTAGATAPLLLATVAAAFGLPTAITYAVAKSGHISRDLVVRAGAVSAVAGVVVTLAVAVLAQAISSRAETRHLMVLASLFLTPSLLIGVLRGVAAGLQRWQAVLHEQLLAALSILLATGLLLATGSLTVTSATFVTAASPLVGAIAYLRLFQQTGLSRPSGQAIPTTGFLTFALRSWAGTVTGILLERLDQALMAWLSTPRQLGLYSVAVSVSQVALLANGAIATVMFANEAASPDDSRLTLAGRVSTLLVIVIGAVIAGGSWPLLGPVFGSGFRSAFVPIIVLLVAVMVGNPGSVGAAALAARGSPGLRSWALVFACAVNVVAVLLLVPPLGASGAALASVAGSFTAGNVGLLFLWRVHGIPPMSFYRLRSADLTYAFRTAQLRLRSHAKALG